jgi:hypothetical protein
LQTSPGGGLGVLLGGWIAGLLLDVSPNLYASNNSSLVGRRSTLSCRRRRRQTDCNFGNYHYTEGITKLPQAIPRRVPDRRGPSQPCSQPGQHTADVISSGNNISGSVMFISHDCKNGRAVTERKSTPDFAKNKTVIKGLHTRRP